MNAFVVRKMEGATPKWIKGFGNLLANQHPNGYGLGWTYQHGKAREFDTPDEAQEAIRILGEGVVVMEDKT